MQMISMQMQQQVMSQVHMQNPQFMNKKHQLTFIIERFKKLHGGDPKVEKILEEAEQVLSLNNLETCANRLQVDSPHADDHRGTPG